MVMFSLDGPQKCDHDNSDTDRQYPYIYCIYMCISFSLFRHDFSPSYLASYCFSSTSMRTVSTMNRSMGATPVSASGTLNSRDGRLDNASVPGAPHYGSHNTSSSAGSHTLDHVSRSREDIAARQASGQMMETVDVHNGYHHQPPQQPTAPDYENHHEVAGEVASREEEVGTKFNYNYYQLSYDTTNAKASHHQNANDNEGGRAGVEEQHPAGGEGSHAEAGTAFYAIERDDNVSHDSYLLSHSQDDSIERELDREANLPELHIDEEKLMREVERGRERERRSFELGESSGEELEGGRGEGSLDGLQSMEEDDEISKAVEDQLDLAEGCVIDSSSRDSTNEDLKRSGGDGIKVIREDSELVTSAEEAELKKAFEKDNSKKKRMSVPRQERVSEDDFIDEVKQDLSFMDAETQENEPQELDEATMQHVEEVAQRFVDEIVEDVKKTVEENADRARREEEVREVLKGEQAEIGDMKFYEEEIVPEKQEEVQSIPNGAMTTEDVKEDSKDVKDEPQERGRDTRKKSVDTDIPYILHRRHMSPEGILEETVTTTGKPKVPPKTLLTQRHRPSKSPSPTRPLTREEQKAKLDKIKSSLTSPMQPPQSNASKSPGAKRAFDLVMSKKLPPVDSFSCRDDSLSPSTEQEIIDHIKQKTEELKMKKRLRNQSEGDKDGKEEDFKSAREEINELKTEAVPPETKKEVSETEKKEDVEPETKEEKAKAESGPPVVLVAPPVLQKRKIIPPKAEMEDLTTEEESDTEEEGVDDEEPELSFLEPEEDLNKVLSDVGVEDDNSSVSSIEDHQQESQNQKQKAVIIKQDSEDFPPPPPPILQAEESYKQESTKPLLQVPTVSVQLPTPEVESVPGLGVPDIIVRPATPLPPSSPEDSPEIKKKSISFQMSTDSEPDLPPPPDVETEPPSMPPVPPLSFVEEIELRIDGSPKQSQGSPISNASTADGEMDVSMVLDSYTSPQDSIDLPLPPPPPAQHEYISSDDEQVMLPGKDDFEDAHAILASQAQANPFSVPMDAPTMEKPVVHDISSDEEHVVLSEQEDFDDVHAILASQAQANPFSVPLGAPIMEKTIEHDISSDEENVMQPDAQDFEDVHAILATQAQANPFSVPMSHKDAPVMENEQEGYDSDNDIPPPPPPEEQPSTSHYISSDDEVMHPTKDDFSDAGDILESQVLANPFSVPMGEHMISPIIHDSQSEDDDDLGISHPKEPAYISSGEEENAKHALLHEREHLAHVQEVLASQAKANPFSVPIATDRPSLTSSSESEVRDDDDEHLPDAADILDADVVVNPSADQFSPHLPPGTEFYKKFAPDPSDSSSSDGDDIKRDEGENLDALEALEELENSDEDISPTGKGVLLKKNSGHEADQSESGSSSSDFEEVPAAQHSSAPFVLSNPMAEGRPEDTIQNPYTESAASTSSPHPPSSSSSHPPSTHTRKS